MFDLILIGDEERSGEVGGKKNSKNKKKLEILDVGGGLKVA